MVILPPYGGYWIDPAPTSQDKASVTHSHSNHRLTGPSCKSCQDQQEGTENGVYLSENSLLESDQIAHCYRDHFLGRVSSSNNNIKKEFCKIYVFKTL